MTSNVAAVTPAVLGGRAGVWIQVGFLYWLHIWLSASHVGASV